MSPYLDDGDAVLYAGDCREVMRELDEGSVAAVVTDPPYALIDVSRNGSGRSNEPDNPYGRHGSHGGGFMGLKWDSPDVAFDPATWREALRVLAPGGHLLAFGGTRTYHRLVCAIEDAGFEIRDTITWHYGSGFPKSLDVGKAIDREAGAEGTYGAPKSEAHAGWIERGRMRGADGHEGYQRPWMQDEQAVDRNARQYAPATPEAARWQGWGTALKPATELIVVARKPLAERTVARQVLATGTGALNVDGCRVAGPPPGGYPNGPGGKSHHYSSDKRSVEVRPDPWEPSSAGRWPPNLVLDDAAAAEMDAQTGERPTGAVTPYREQHVNASSYQMARDKTFVKDADTGGASRFFPRFNYCAKADGAERDGATHPTVKPLALMRWLVRLVTPPGGTVLDPFAGSGTTLLAARQEGFRSIGIEREQEYLAMAAHRLRQLSLLA